MSWSKSNVEEVIGILWLIASCQVSSKPVMLLCAGMALISFIAAVCYGWNKRREP